jgi:hypothetical protein
MCSERETSSTVWDQHQLQAPAFEELVGQKAAGHEGLERPLDNSLAWTIKHGEASVHSGQTRTHNNIFIVFKDPINSVHTGYFRTSLSPKLDFNCIALQLLFMKHGQCKHALEFIPAFGDGIS